MGHEKEASEDCLRFRIEPSLIEAIDRFAAFETRRTKKKCTRARAARLLIAAGVAGVDNRSRNAAVESLSSDMRKALHAALQRAGAELAERLPDLVQAELR